MIPWTHAPAPQATREATITIGPCQLSVREHVGDSGQRWTFLMIALGEFNDSPFDECLKTWPQRAVQLAHQAVNELDRKLQEVDE